MSVYQVSPAKISIETIEKILSEKKTLTLSVESKKRIEKCYSYLQKKIKNSKEPIYGINTGFGSLCNTTIPAKDLEKLQENLVRSHACGTGEEVPQEIVKLMLLLKIHALSLGHSGVSLKTVEQLIALFNKNILPVVYQQGSLGASGDLAPLAHLSLALIGEGEVNHNGIRTSAKQALQKEKLQSIKLQPKEGLALLNGTQFMSAYGTWCAIKAMHLSKWADITGCLSLEAYDGRPEPFDEDIQSIRPHNGQRVTAENFRNLLKGSQLIKRKKTHVQDPYSFRCIPQVHGASKDAIRYFIHVMETEINSVTDNPTIFPDEDKVISAGNFHGQPLAIAFDFLSIALAELGSISERRTYKLISGTRGLPAFLVKDAGLNSGFMIPQYTAASIASQNKQLCTPASVDTIDSSNGQEDHVSMGANAATKAFRVTENTEKLLAIELMNATQAIGFRRPLKTASLLEKMITTYRKKIPQVSTDIYLHPAISGSIEFIKNFTLSGFPVKSH
ncbi:MAG: histidine ammonia-lyase [Bacteroidota bacterium]